MNEAADVGAANHEKARQMSTIQSNSEANNRPKRLSTKEVREGLGQVTKTSPTEIEKMLGLLQNLGRREAPEPPQELFIKALQGGLLAQLRDNNWDDQSIAAVFSDQFPGGATGLLAVFQTAQNRIKAAERLAEKEKAGASTSHTNSDIKTARALKGRRRKTDDQKSESGKAL